ncbi:MAG TPA: methyltransferase domain-containing protein [Rubrobacteraceae bacterium]|nr:methyltransferase domain-containing protein [Rubrobacteraceae bacterium]
MSAGGDARRNGRDFADRLPKGLRGLVRLATVNPRLDRVVANQNRLGEQVKRIDARSQQLTIQTRELDQKLQNANLAGMRETINSQKARIDQLEAQLSEMLAGNAPVGKRELSERELRAEISKVDNWYHTIQLAPGHFTPGSHKSDLALAAMHVPEDLSGKRVLDVGARDGFFSFVAEARGAEVLAIDAVAPNLTGFSVAAPLMDSSVRFETMNVYDLDPETVGEFDAIFFLGVLYHLRDPMLALDRLWSVAKPGATVWVESHVADYGLVDPESGEWRSLAAVAPDLVDVPMAQFYPDDLLANSTTNWWGPNLAGLRAMVEAAGFEILRTRFVGGRGLVVGRKVEDEDTDFYREFDRGTATGEEGMAWESVKQWYNARPPAESKTALRRNREVSPEEARAEVAKFENWYHRIEVAPGVVTPGVHDSEAALEAMEVPESFEGMRVLDVGARDGYFSFVAEARGAEVLAIDAVALEHLQGFSTAAALLGSSVEYKTMNVYDVSPENVGQFDAIFFLGVLYHLRDPMLALDRLWSVCRPGATIWVESHTIDHGFIDPATGEQKSFAAVAPALAKYPMAQFYPKGLLGGNQTNWWGPNLAGLEAMVRSAGFEVQRSRLVGGRGLVVGKKVEDENTNFYRWYDRGVVTDKKDQRA